MNIYVVCEDYTGAFLGVFTDRVLAESRAAELGGYVLDYDTDTCNEACISD